MNFIAQVEEHLRDLGAEARKKHPGVKEASERAILQLRSLQNAYVTAVRKATQTGGAHPTTELFRSQDLLRPFLLAANYPNASLRLLQISLSAMSLLMEGNAICPGDGIHMVRVWIIQANVCASSLRKSSHHHHSTQKASPTASTSSSWFGGMLSSSSQNNDVSSSTPAAGGGRKESEKLAVELLSCLLQLLELKDLPVTDEQWASSIQLCCILLHVEKSTTVQQAAHSTLHQVLGLLFESQSDYGEESWHDLIKLASGDTGNLQGGFSHCTGTGPSPPLQEMCLELMHSLLSQDDIWLASIPDLMEPTIQLTQSQFLSGLETLVKSTQLARVLLLRKSDSYSQLIETLVEGIVVATDTCRKNHDFEDGFVYYGGNMESPKRQKVTTLIPSDVLWRAGLALETLLGSVPCLDKSASLVAEAISDFCTIGASCHDHMMQVVECEDCTTIEMGRIEFEPKMIRRAEETIKAKGDNTAVSCHMGQALWIAFHCILRLVQEYGAQPQCFAPSLAVFQHYLKRFPGSATIVHCTLEGYFHLATAAVPRNDLFRQALLSSLCKLSLPSWGKHDPLCQLDAYHIDALVCLLKIIHEHYDSLRSEWRVILWTFQELSTLSISSSLLSDEGYANALAISSTFARIAPLSTCVSPESLIFIIDALADISTSMLERRDVLTDRDSSTARTVEISKPRRDSVDVSKTERRAATSNRSVDFNDPKTKESLSGKLMSFAGRTLMGSHTPDAADDLGPIVMERTKNTYFGSYQQDFIRRLVSSRRAFRSDAIDKLPFSLVALTDVAMANMYRYKMCGATISNHLSSLAATSPDIRAFAMDILVMLVEAQVSEGTSIPSTFSGPGRISIVQPMKNQFLVVESVERNGSGTEETESQTHQSMSQADLVTPLCETMRTAETNELAESAVLALHSILEGTGHNMDTQAWTVLIVALSSLSGDVSKADLCGVDRSGGEWSNCCMLAFRCLKLIVDDFLDQLPPLSESGLGPRAALLDCCSSFGSSRQDVNISLTAVGLLWSIADQDSNSWSIDRVLSELVVLSSDSRTEVRNCAVNTLFSCIVGRGQGFTADQWEVCIDQTIFGVYDQVSSRGGIGNGGAEDDSEGGARVKKSKTSSDRYKVSVHHSRDSAGKQWTTTEVIVLQGLSRVLRSFFPRLIGTMDSSTYADDIAVDHDPLWFKKTWTRTLDVALNAARQSASRETLDLRAVGVDLLVLCCQLTCKAGEQAAITPARVGTNMEVVNGALRHIHDTPLKPDPNTEILDKASSLEVEQWREQFFLAAFDSLDAYRAYLEAEARCEPENGLSPCVDPTQVQVLHKLVLGLGKLYDCCRNNEFAPGGGRQSRNELILESKSDHDPDQDDLESLFVNMVATIAVTATGDPGARFLTQAQRAALELLRAMSSQSSEEAIRVLAAMGGHSFFWTARSGDSDDRVDEETASGPSAGAELLSREAAKAVTEELSTGTVSDATKVQVLYRILSVFVDEKDNDQFRKRNIKYKRCYALLVPIVQSGLQSAAKLQDRTKLLSTRNEHVDDKAEMKRSNHSEVEWNGSVDCSIIEGTSVDVVNGLPKDWDHQLWEKVRDVLSQLLLPLRRPSHGPYISRAAHVLDILNAVLLHVPQSQHDSICTVLSSGASASVEIGKLQTALSQDESRTTEARRKARGRRDEALKVFEACFGGICRYEPLSQRLCALTKEVLEDVVSPEPTGTLSSSESELRADLAVTICRAISNNANMERLVIGLFSLLCRLMSSDNELVRREARMIVATVDVGQVLENAARRCELAEERAQGAEALVRGLHGEVKNLRDENESLQQKILVYSASSALIG